jgi:translocation and assembly module TamB
MRRAAKWLGWTLAVLLGTVVTLIGAVFAALNIAPSRDLAARQVGKLTGGQVAVSGLAGRFPDALRVARIEISDARGVWLSLDDVALDWSPLALLHRDAKLARVSAVVVSVARLPEDSGGAASASTGSGGFDLPVRVDIDALHVERIELAAAVAGVAAVLAVDGSAHLASMRQGTADILVRRVDGAGSYHVAGSIDANSLKAEITADEPAHGLASAVAQLPDLGALSLRATLAGPWTAAVTHVAISAGELRAGADGKINIDGKAADLDVTATAPAMAPRPDVAWLAVALDAHVHGPLATPQASGNVRIDGLTAAGAAMSRLVAKLDGNAGQATLTASIDGIRVPGPKPDLLEASPLTLTARAVLDKADRPVMFTADHKLLALRGEAQTGGDLRLKAHLDLPDLAPLAAVGGVDIQGHTALDLTGGVTSDPTTGDTTTVALDGTLAVTGGMAPVPGLLGPEARIGFTAALHGSDIAVSRLTVGGRTVTLAAHGAMTGGVIALDWQTAVSDLSVLAATVQGAFQAQGHVQGATDNLSVQADVNGEVATAGVPRGPIKLALAAQGLPNAPTGTVRAEGSLDGAPLLLDAGLQRQSDGTLQLSIARADWKSAHAEGAVSLPPHAVLPEGKLALRMDRLDDLNRLLGQPLVGAVTANFDLGEQDGRKLAKLQLEAKGAGLVGVAQVARATLAARVLDPVGEAEVDATLDVAGLEASGIAGTAQLAARGKQAALGLKLQAALRGVGGADLAADGAATLDVPGKRIMLSSLQAVWKGETLRLLAPAQVAFGNGVAVDRARIGLRNAELEVAGRALPTLDLTVALRNVTADLARIVSPDLDADGTLQADAKLGGTPRRPTGTARLAATGLHLRSGPAAGLPPASFTADLTLSGATARVQARASAGRNDFELSGTAPIDPAAAMEMKVRGGINLAVLDPLMAASGRRVQGQISLDAAIAGTLAAPRADGTLRLTGGDVQDFTQGAHISGIQALIQASGDTVHIASFSGKAGGGSIGASGTVGLAGAMPVNLRVTAKNASPLASDKLTAVLDMDLALRGDLQGALGVSGSIKVNRADIRIPDKLPAQVAVLNVRLPGQKPPPPSVPGPAIALDVTLSAPGQVFVRGRGLFAELQGRIHVTGSAAAPQPIGKFTLRRGEFNLVGQTLTFTTGEVGFDGSGKLDPTLNFVANSNNGTIIATLTITGYASAPKIALSSTPERPQDEVLAQLLFHQSSSSLSPLQLAQAAAALAQISGVTGGAFDPLNSVRQGLGLDRLSLGGSQNGTGATVEAGRYVTQGVYVGAKQGTSGSGTQATVQIDLYRGLKLETDVGAGGSTSTTGSSSTSDPSGTSVGLNYHFDY